MSKKNEQSSHANVLPAHCLSEIFRINSLQQYKSTAWWLRCKASSDQHIYFFIEPNKTYTSIT